MVHNSVSNALACCLQIHLPCICSSLLVNGRSHQSLWLLLLSEDLHRSHFPQIVTHPSKGFTRTCWDPHLSPQGSAGILNNTDRRDGSWCGTTAGKTALGGKWIFMLLKVGISGKHLLCYKHVQLWALRMVQRAKELAAKLEDLGYVSRVHLVGGKSDLPKMSSSLDLCHIYANRSKTNTYFLNVEPFFLIKKNSRLNGTRAAWLILHIFLDLWHISWSFLIFGTCNSAQIPLVHHSGSAFPQSCIFSLSFLPRR